MLFGHPNCALKPRRPVRSSTWPDQAALAPAEDIQEYLLKSLLAAAKVGNHLDIREAHLVAITLKTGGLNLKLSTLVMRGVPGLANGLPTWEISASDVARTESDA